MSVQEILRAQSGNYEATGIYSFEFRQAGSGLIFPGGPNAQSIEIPLLLPPESVTYSEPQRSALLKTMGGGFLVDYGNDFKGIDIAGSCHFFYAGTTRGQTEGASLTASELLDGYTEFIKLRWMLSRYRDFIMTETGTILDPFPLLPSIPGFVGFVAAVMERIGDGRGSLSDQIEVIFHDYDMNNHHKVRIDTFGSTQTKDDPWTVSYTIRLETYQTETQALRNVGTAASTVRRIPALESIRKAVLFTGNIAPDSAPDELPVSVSGDSPLITTHTSREQPTNSVNFPVGIPA